MIFLRAYLVLLATFVLAAAAVGEPLPTSLDGLASGSGATDVALTAQASPHPAVPGGRLTYTLDVANLGSGNADGKKIDVGLSDYLSFVSIDGCQHDPSHFPRCHLSGIGQGQTTQVTLVVAVSPEAKGRLIFEADLSGGDDPNPANDSVRLSTPTTAEVRVGSGSSPSIASDPTGSETFAVVWQRDAAAQSLGQSPDALGAPGVHARLFNSPGMPIGIELQLDSGSIETASKPDVARYAEGEYVAVWQAADGSGSGVFGQRFSSQGMPIGIELSVNSTTALEQTQPAVTQTGDGGFVVTYSDEVGVNDFRRALRRFSSQGMPIGIEVHFGANDTSATPPGVASSGDKLLVVWEDAGDGGVSGQLFSSQGMPIGIEIAMASATSSQAPAAAATSSGDFLVVWQDDSGLDGDGSGVYAQLLGGAGMPIGIEYRLTESVSGDQQSPKIASAPDGSFAVTWKGPDGIGARLLSIQGMPIGIELRLGRPGGLQDSAEPVFVDADGNFYVAWREEDSGESTVVVGPPETLFADGFESQDTDAWSVQIPTQDP